MVKDLSIETKEELIRSKNFINPEQEKKKEVDLEKIQERCQNTMKQNLLETCKSKL